MVEAMVVMVVMAVVIIMEGITLTAGHNSADNNQQLL
jgi:hypothetical protein